MPAEQQDDEFQVVGKTWDKRWDDRHKRGWKKTALNKWIMGSIEAQVQSGELPAGSEILDLGCGTGRYLFELVNRGYSLTGVDISAKALCDLRAKLQNGQPARLVQGESRNLSGIHNECMDLVLSAGAIHHNCWEGIEASFAEVARVLKPGKRFLFADRFIEDTAAVRNKVSDFGYAARDIEGGKEEIIQHYFTTDELVQLAEDHGFEIVTGPIVYAGARNHDPSNTRRIRCFVDYRKKKRSNG